MNQRKAKLLTSQAKEEALARGFDFKGFYRYIKRQYNTVPRNLRHLVQA